MRCSRPTRCRYFVAVGRVLAEVARVLRPGGLFYAHFGPIWSGVDGHQLEYVRYADRDLGFWRDTLLPPWAHLAYERDELAALLATGLPAGLVELLVHHVHDGDTINRLFFEDYVAAALGSGLEWVQVAGVERALTTMTVPPDLDASLVRDVDQGGARARDLAAARAADAARDPRRADGAAPANSITTQRSVHA